MNSLCYVSSLLFSELCITLLNKHSNNNQYRCTEWLAIQPSDMIRECISAKNEIKIQTVTTGKASGEMV